MRKIKAGEAIRSQWGLTYSKMQYLREESGIEFNRPSSNKEGHSWSPLNALRLGLVAYFFYHEGFAIKRTESDGSIVHPARELVDTQLVPLLDEFPVGFDLWLVILNDYPIGVFDEGDTGEEFETYRVRGIGCKEDIYVPAALVDQAVTKFPYESLRVINASELMRHIMRTLEIDPVNDLGKVTVLPPPREHISPDKRLFLERLIREGKVQITAEQCRKFGLDMNVFQEVKKK